MIRDRPPDDPRVWPRANRSKPSTDAPRDARWYAAELPCAPSPATMTSTAATSLMASVLGETLDERERRRGALPPPAVDRQRVPAVWYLGDLGHALVPLLLLVRGIG